MDVLTTSNYTVLEIFSSDGDRNISKNAALIYMICMTKHIILVYICKFKSAAKTCFCPLAADFSLS